MLRTLCYFKMKFMKEIELEVSARVVSRMLIDFGVDFRWI